MNLIVAYIVVLLGTGWIGYLFWVAPAFGIYQLALVLIVLLMRLFPHFAFFVFGAFFGFRR